MEFFHVVVELVLYTPLLAACSFVLLTEVTVAILLLVCIYRLCQTYHKLTLMNRNIIH